MAHTFDVTISRTTGRSQRWPLLIDGLGSTGPSSRPAKCIEELVELTRPDVDAKAAKKNGAVPACLMAAAFVPPPVTVTCRSADALTTSPTRAWTRW